MPAGQSGRRGPRRDAILAHRGYIRRVGLVVSLLFSCLRSFSFLGASAVGPPFELGKAGARSLINSLLLPRIVLGCVPASLLQLPLLEYPAPRIPRHEFTRRRLRARVASAPGRDSRLRQRREHRVKALCCRHFLFCSGAGIRLGTPLYCFIPSEEMVPGRR